MKFDYREDPDNAPVPCTLVLTVNGEEIQECWFCDQDAGVVKTYDVLGDNRIHTVRESADGSPRPRGEIEILDGLLYSKTIRGKVEIRDR